MQEQYGFAAKMRNQAIEQLKALETWVERQATGLDMAALPESLRQSFDKLLKVSHAACCVCTYEVWCTKQCMSWCMLLNSHCLRCHVDAKQD